jgi:hypothetical protein
MWSRLNWPRMSPVAGSSEHDEHSGMKRGREFPDQWSNYWLLKDSVNAVKLHYSFIFLIIYS